MTIQDGAGRAFAAGAAAFGLETKDVAFEQLATVAEDGRIEGYASLFGVPDQGGDVVEAGAFARSLERLRAAAPAITVGVQVMGSAAIPRALTEGAANLGVAFNLVPPPELREVQRVSFKLGAVMGVVLVLAVLSRPIRRFPRLLSILSAETLTIYVFHLMVLYFGNIGLYRFFGGSLSLPRALCASAGMVVLTTGYTVLWHKVKKGEIKPLGWLRRG